MAVAAEARGRETWAKQAQAVEVSGSAVSGAAVALVPHVECPAAVLSVSESSPPLA
jgi:2-keto-3-deoxy-galactonokinase